MPMHRVNRGIFPSLMYTAVLMRCLLLQVQYGARLQAEEAGSSSSQRAAGVCLRHRDSHQQQSAAGRRGHLHRL